MGIHVRQSAHINPKIGANIMPFHLNRIQHKIGNLELGPLIIPYSLGLPNQFNCTPIGVSTCAGSIILNIAKIRENKYVNLLLISTLSITLSGNAIQYTSPLATNRRSKEIKAARGEISFCFDMRNIGNHKTKGIR